MQHPNKSAADIAARITFFQTIANDLIGTILPSSAVIFRGARVAPMVDGYFLLNDAYKRWRINPGHNTKPSKIAALTCMSIATFLPFRPANNLVTFLIHLKCNEIYALTCALAILRNPVGYNLSVNRNLVLRLFGVISDSRSESLEPFLVDLQMQISKNSYTLNVLDKDKLPLNSLISIFELMEKQFSIAKELATI